MTILTSKVSDSCSRYNSVLKTTYSYPAKEKSISTSFTDTKGSVDDGTFKPGVFRINPFLRFGMTDYKDEFNFTIPMPKDQYVYTYKLAGSWTKSVLASVNNQTGYAVPTYEKDLALQKAMAAVNEGIMQAGVELGELRETISMLRHPLKNLREFLALNHWDRVRDDLLRYLATGAFRSYTGKKAVKAAASTWMEVRYGLRPLVGSVEDVIRLIKDGLDQFNDRLQNGRGMVPSHVVQSIEKPRTTIVAGSYSWITGVPKVTDELITWGSVTYRNTKPQPILNQLGLSASHLPSIAWELTRLSFVVDWFLGIGPWIDSLRYQPGTVILGNTVGWKVVRTISINSPYFYGYWTNKAPVEVKMADCWLEYQKYTRICNHTAVTPRLIGLDKMDLYKAIDLALIALQSLKL